MMENAFVQACIDAYNELLALCMPTVFFIAACNLCINMLVCAFMTGKLRIGGKQ